MVLSEIMPELPKNDEVFKLISLGGFSGIAFISQNYLISIRNYLN